MKKLNSLWRTVRKAQRSWAKLPPERRDTVRLEGRDLYLSRVIKPKER